MNLHEAKKEGSTMFSYDWVVQYYETDQMAIVHHSNYIRWFEEARIDRKTVQYLYEAGAKEVHVRPACPPILFGCKYLNFSRSTSEMDLITRRIIAEIEGTEEVSKELIECYTNPDHPKYLEMVEGIRKKMNFNTLKYHRLDDLIEAIGLEPCKLCTYCFNGKEEND